jgi:hypothetical protein
MRTVVFSLVQQLTSHGDPYYMMEALESGSVSEPSSLSAVLERYIDWNAMPVENAALVRRHIAGLRAEESKASTVSQFERLIERNAVIDTVCALFPSESSLDMHLSYVDELPRFSHSVSMSSGLRGQVNEYWDVLLSDTRLAARFLVMLAEKVPNHPMVIRNLPPQLVLKIRQYL